MGKSDELLAIGMGLVMLVVFGYGLLEMILSAIQNVQRKQSKKIWVRGMMQIVDIVDHENKRFRPRKHRNRYCYYQMLVCRGTHPVAGTAQTLDTGFQKVNFKECVVIGDFVAVYVNPENPSKFVVDYEDTEPMENFPDAEYPHDRSERIYQKIQNKKSAGPIKSIVSSLVFIIVGIAMLKLCFSLGVVDSISDGIWIVLVSGVFILAGVAGIIYQIKTWGMTQEERDALEPKVTENEVEAVLNMTPEEQLKFMKERIRETDERNGE